MDLRWLNKGLIFLATGAIVGSLVAGCSGGGGDGGGGNNPVTLSGTAASGLPVAGKAISIKDKNGNTASNTTRPDGTYSFDVTNMTAPFLLRVPDPAVPGGYLYSVATSSGTANVHSFTDMIVRNWYVVQNPPSDVDTAFGTSGAMPTPPTEQAIATIEAVVRQILATYMNGADVNPSGFNLITTPFTADHSGFDLVLDNLTVTQSGGNVTIGANGGSTILEVANTTDLATVTPPPARLSGETVPPSAPGLITANRTSAKQVVVSWVAATDNTGVAGYKVYRNGMQIGITDQPFYVDGAAPATSAAYNVSAFDADGNNSGLGNQVPASDTSGVADLTSPSDPGNPVATALSSSEIKLTWSASTDNVAVAGYRVMVGGAAIASLPASATSYTQIKLNGDTTYNYVIVAIDTSGNVNQNTASASAYTPVPSDTTPPSTPTGLTATAISASQINLAWTASTDNVGVTGYEVYLGASTIAMATSASTTFSAANLTAGTQYCFTVKAYDAASNTALASAQACATTQANVLAQLMVGNWWHKNNDDGTQPDGLRDDVVNELDGVVTISVGADGAWTYTGPGTVSGGPANVTFPASAVTVSGNTVTLMDPNGLGRSLLTYDAATKTIIGQWQRFYNSAWSTFETWTDTNLIADTWFAADGTTYTFNADGSYTGWVAGPNGDGSGGYGYEQGTYTWNSSTGAFVGNDLTHNNLNQAATVTADYTLTHTNASGSYTFYRYRAAKPSTIVGGWTMDGTVGSGNLITLTLFTNGDYLFTQDYVGASPGGMERGKYSFNPTTGAFNILCPALVDTNGDAGVSHPLTLLASGACSGTTGTASVSGNALTLTVTGSPNPADNGTSTFTRLFDATNPAVGAWAVTSYSTATGPITPNLIEMTLILPNGEYVLASSGAALNGTDGIERGTGTWNSSTGVVSMSCPVLDTNGTRGLSDILTSTCGIPASQGATRFGSGNTAIMTVPGVPAAGGGAVTMTSTRVTEPTSGTPPQSFGTYALPAGSFGFGLTTGPDGNLWYADMGANSIGKMTPAGVVTLYPIPSIGSNGQAGSAPQTIVSGPDGNLWFVEGNGNKIGRITTAGVITEYPNTAGGWPQDLAVGPDGNIWFTDQGHWGGGAGTTSEGAIGMVNVKTGVVTKYSLLTTNTQANFITLGPDGAMWFTQGIGDSLQPGGSNTVARIDMAGNITVFPNTGGAFITTGSDGNLWVAVPIPGAAAIGKLTTAGVQTNFPVPSASYLPFSITAAPDGSLWFSETNNVWPSFGTAGNLGRITTSGVVSEFPVPTPIANPNAGEPSLGVVTVGPDGAIWFSDPASSRIVRFQP